MATKKDDGKLSPLGRRMESMLMKQLTVMEAEIKAARGEKRDPKYSLTDFTKVWDRALKLEAIRQRVAGDGEGDFFKNREPEEGQTDEDE